MMDQLSAHLERGWDLVQRGDVTGARASAQRALALDPNAPEIHNLVGYVAALDGDNDEALEAYLQAIELDDHYVEAMLNAAELLVHPLDDPAAALRMCDQVLDLTEYDDEVVDALLIKFEAHHALEAPDEARHVLALLPAGPYENPGHNFLVGRAHYEAGDKEKARALIEAALAGDDTHAETHYYAGLLAEDAGDRRGAAVAFLRTRQLELELGMPAWAPNPEAFLLFTRGAVEGLPAHQQAYLETAELYVADVPGPEMVVDGVDPRTMVLVDASFVAPPEGDVGPKTAGASTEGAPEDAPAPEHVELRVFLYAVNILRIAVGLHDVQRTIAVALERELAHILEDLAAERREGHADLLLS